MSLDLSKETAFPLVIGSSGSNDLKVLRSIKIFQLVTPNKNKIKKEGFTMITKQSNSIISVIHRLVTDEYGENYWFNGSTKYVMKCLGEKDYDYWFFAGITGDVFTQYYKQPFSGDSIDAHFQANGDISNQYRRTADIWNNDDGNDLEALGGGFNVTLEALQNPKKRKKIAARIRECGGIIDGVARIINENRKGYSEQFV